MSENENRSRKAAGYGALVEKYGRKRYGLEADHGRHHDALDDDGRPWDFKGAMLSRDDPRFRLWQDQHRHLSRNDGGYVFVAYVPDGERIQVARSRTVRADSIRLSFYGAGGHRDGAQQVKVPIGRIF